MCIFSAPSPPSPPPLPAPPSRDDREARQAELEERRRRVNAAGRASTILTGGRGVTGDQVATPGTKTLLGQ